MSGFQLKDFVSISAAMINVAKATQDKLTDFEVGSVARTLMEAPAVEIDELYQKVFSGILDAIPTAIYKAFDFELMAETTASGTLRIVFAGPVVDAFTIPSGSLFGGTGALKYAATAAVAVPVGALAAAVPVACQSAGAAGNIGANALTASLTYTLPVGAALGNDAIFSGRDAQSESDRKARFIEFILSLSRGTMPALRYAVRKAQVVNDTGQLTEYVARVGAVEEAGRVFLYIYGSGGAASVALLSAGQRIIDGYRDTDTGAQVPGYRAGGVQVLVMPMRERLVPVALQVWLQPGAAGNDTLKNAIATALAPEFDTVESGGVLYIEQLINAALTVPGVQKVTASNNSNEPCSPTEALRLGALSVEWRDA